MKISLYIIACLLFTFVSCNSPTSQTNSTHKTDIEANQLDVASDTSLHQQLPAKNPPYIVTKSQVGPIKTGMPLSEVKALIFKENIKEIAITREGQGTKTFEIRLDPDAQSPDLVIEEKCEPTCKVWRLHVKSPIIKTPEGLGIGSTLGEIKRFYKIDFIGPGETEIVAVSQKSKITFLLDVQKLPAKTIPRLTVSNTPEEVKVIGMFIL